MGQFPSLGNRLPCMLVESATLRVKFPSGPPYVLVSWRNGLEGQAVFCFYPRLKASSPCWLMSRPWSSSSMLTLRGENLFMILSSAYEPKKEKAATTAIASDWIASWCMLPVISPLMLFMEAVAKSPMPSAPIMPPMPWQAKTSKESSILDLAALQLAMRLEMIPAAKPIMTAAVTFT